MRGLGSSPDISEEGFVSEYSLCEALLSMGGIFLKNRR